MYQTKWKSPCILEHILADEQKRKKLVKAFTSLHFRIVPSSDHGAFFIEKE